MLVLSEQLRLYRGVLGVLVRKNQNNEGSKSWYVVISMDADILTRAGLLETTRIEAILENESIVFFKPTVPGGGWALSRPGRSKRVYFRIPYKEGMPFVLNDKKNHKLKELAVDAEKQTITMATVIEEGQENG